MYSKENWKETRAMVTTNIINQLTNAGKETDLFKAVSKGVTRAFDESFATAEKKAEFLTNPDLSPSDLFSSTRVTNKDALVAQIVEYGLLPLEIASTLTGKQLQALIDSYKQV